MDGDWKLEKEPRWRQVSYFNPKRVLDLEPRERRPKKFHTGLVSSPQIES